MILCEKYCFWSKIGVCVVFGKLNPLGKRLFGSLAVFEVKLVILRVCNMKLRRFFCAHFCGICYAFWWIFCAVLLFSGFLADFWKLFRAFLRCFLCTAVFLWKFWAWFCALMCHFCVPCAYTSWKFEFLRIFYPCACLGACFGRVLCEFFVAPWPLWCYGFFRSSRAKIIIFVKCLLTFITPVWYTLI